MGTLSCMQRSRLKLLEFSQAQGNPEHGKRLLRADRQPALMSLFNLWSVQAKGRQDFASHHLIADQIRMDPVHCEKETFEGGIIPFVFSHGLPHFGAKVRQWAFFVAGELLKEVIICNEPFIVLIQRVFGDHRRCQDHYLDARGLGSCDHLSDVFLGSKRH